jgi:hypothetical protein
MGQDGLNGSLHDVVARLKTSYIKALELYEVVERPGP